MSLTLLHLDPGRRFVVVLFCGSSQRVKAAVCFCWGAPLLMFGKILNVSLSEEWKSTTGVNSPCFQILLIHTKHKTIK